MADVGNSSDSIYDLVIVGASPEGLKGALDHLRRGKKVLVLERNNRAGGACAGFRRGQFRFDTSPGDIRESYELEKNVYDLGGEIWYKTVPAEIGRDHVKLSDGRIIFCEKVLSFSADDTDRFTVWLGVKNGPEEPDLNKETGSGPAVIRLEKSETRNCFDKTDAEEYFQVKNKLIAEAVRDYEKKHGISLHDSLIEADAATPLTWNRYAGNDLEPSRLADSLHPAVQFGKILKVVDRGHAKSFVIGPDPERGTSSLAYFRAGQYVSIMDQVGKAIICKPYSICSGPKDALGPENTSYTVMIERNPDGFFSPHALDTWKQGKKLVLSGPLGYFYYQPTRDCRHVVALAGSSGVTPFYAMAAAIADGTEDFSLTVLYGSRTADTILLREELDALVQRSEGRVRVIHVLSEEQRTGYEHGFINSDLIRKYAPEDEYSVFICGPKAMYAHLRRELPKLGLPESRVRFELPGEFGDPASDPAYPKENTGKIYKLTVRERGSEKSLRCRSDQTLMQAIERAGILIEADCRSGQCGWCRSRLISGNVFVPESRDGRLKDDAEFGWVHPCVTYPLSDLELEIYNH